MLKKGFTLIEVIVAIFLITVGIIGSYILITQTISYTQYNSDKLVASYLAQEGIEIIRNIRDTNWLQPSTPWDNGLTSCSVLVNPGGCTADYTINQLHPTFGFYTSNEFLKFDSASGFYNYSAGTKTKFKRKIVINPGTNILHVYVFIGWDEKGVPYSINAQEDLYNWRNM